MHPGSVIIMYQLVPLALSAILALALGESEVGMVFQGLQWKRVDILDLSIPNNISSIKNVVKGASMANVLISGTYSYDNSNWKTRSFPFDALVCLCHDRKSLAFFKDVLLNAKFSSERIMLLTVFQWSNPKMFFESLNMSRSFFWHKFGSNTDYINRIQTIRNRTISVQNVWPKKEGIYDRVYNFQGAPFTVLAPARDYYVINEPMSYNLCSHNPEMACNVTGYEVRFFNMLQRRLNFTLEIYLEKKNNWGTTVTSGKMGIALTHHRYVAVFK